MGPYSHGGSPKSSISRFFFHEINHPAIGVPMGTPILGNLQINGTKIWKKDGDVDLERSY